jgi:ketosteroid isomerase-like protein
MTEAEAFVQNWSKVWRGRDSDAQTGTLHGAPLELRDADRYTLREGKATEGHAYFDPRLFLDEQAAPPHP